MRTLGARLLQIAMLMAAMLSTSSYAEHLDPVPLPQDVAQKIAQIHPAQKNQLAEALDQHLESLNVIANNTQQTPEAQRMLLAGKRSELKTLNQQAIDELTQMRQRYIDAGMGDRLADLDQFAAQVQQRFKHLDQTLADIEIDGSVATTQSVTGKVANQDKTSNRQIKVHALRTELDSLHNTRVNQDQIIEGPIEPTFKTFQMPHVKPFPASKSVPQYLSQFKPTMNQYAFLGNQLLAAAPAISSDAASCGYQSADLAATPDAPQTAEITALVAQLNYSPAKIFAYVHDNIQFEPYYGSLKGALETLHSKAGGPTDQASLLIALLRASNIPARYVRGQVYLADDPSSAIATTGGRVAQWVGAKSYIGAANILAQGRFGPSYQSNSVQFNQVWVEACVPYAHYRGASSDTSGERWIPLDPSYKDKTYQSGITTSVAFDYTTYLSKLQNGPDSLPEEAYAKQVEASVRASDPNLTVQDIPYTGTINPLQLDILPNSLPYEIVNFTNWPGTTSPEIAKLPDDHRYAWYIGGLGFTATDVTGYLKLYVPDVASQRVTLSFAGATASDQTAINNWLSSTLPCTSSIDVKPVVMLEGVAQTLPLGSKTTLCSTNNSLKMVVGLKELGSTGASDTLAVGAVNSTSYNNIGGVNWHSLHAYAFQASRTLLNQRAANLLQAVDANANPIASVAAMDATEGEYLNIMGLKYMRYITDASETVGSLTGGSGQSGNHLGLVSSQMKVSYLFDLPFAVSSSGFLVDMPGEVSRSVNITTGNLDFDSFLLGAYAGSAYESYVLQENVHTDAVSTVRGLQFANQKGIAVLTGVNAANWGVCSTVGTNCYKLSNGPSPQYSAQQISNIKTSYIDQGFTLTIPVSNIQYSSTWTGMIFVATKQDTSSYAAGFIINKFNGGWTVAPPQPTNIFSVVSNSFFTSAPEIPSIFYNPPAATNFTNYNPTVPVNNTTATSGWSIYTVTAGDPVNMVNGNMYHQERDFSIKGRGGLPLVFERFYNSNHPADGPLGFGWTHSFNHMIKLYGVENGAAKLSWVDGTGREIYFSTTNHSAGIVFSNTTVPSPSGIYSTLQRTETGTYTIREKNGLIYTFANVNGLNQAITSTSVPTIAKLLSITDRNGNTLTMNYTATSTCTGGTLLCTVTDSLNRSLNFSYTGNHINKITDFTGRAFQYGYTDGNNNLTSFSNPLAIAGTQNPETYSYYTTADGTSFNHLMKQYTLPRGNGMRFEYYANGRTFRHTVVQTDGSLSPDQINSFTYNDFRRETVQTNELGYERHFFFDPFGNMIQLVEENGATRRYTYDCADTSQAPGSASCKNPFNRLSKTEPDGYTTSYTYDALGNVTQVTTPRGATQQYADYTAFNQPRRIKDANGNWTINRYDAKGNTTDTIQAVSGYSPASCASAECALPVASQIKSWLSKGYDSIGNLTSSKLVSDFTTQAANNSPTSDTGPLMLYGYDANQLNMTSMSRRGKFNTSTTGAVINSATLGYDSLGRLQTGVDNDWYATTTNYDALDRISSATDKLGNLRNYSYDANNNLIGQTLKIGSNLDDSSSIIYDATDRKVQTLDSAGNVAVTSYDAASNVIAVTNPDNYSISFDYDANNRPIYAYDQEDNAVFTIRDVSGRVRSVTDPNGNTNSNQYWDSSRDGRLKNQSMPKLSNKGDGKGYTTGHQLQYDYDANGNVTVVTDIPAAGSGQSNRVTATSYDELNRATRIVGPQYTDAKYGLVCPVTLNHYSNLGQLDQVKAGYTPSPCATSASDITKLQMAYIYDDFGHQIYSVDGNNRVTSFVYDNNNNLQTKTDTNQQTTTFNWGYGHQLQSRVEQGGRTTTYGRNALGQVTSITHPNASFTYNYDAAHRLSLVTETRAGQTGSKTMRYDWSPGGLLNSLTDNDGGITNYLYDPVGRLSGVTMPNGDTVTVRFDAGGRLHEKFTNQGIYSLYQYNEDNSLASLTNRTAQAQSTGNTSTALSAHSFTYDGFGQRINQSQTINGTTINYAYSYDALNRLTQVSNGNSAQTETNTYDPWNNRTSQQKGTTLTSYVYDNANQLTQIYNGTQATGTLAATYSYDNNGNLKSDGTRTYTWDALNQLAQVNLGSTVTTYAYDDQGRRIQKTYNNGSTSSTNQYSYQGDNIYAEYGASWNTPTAIYSHLGTDQPLARATVTAPNTYGAVQYYAQDGIGSVVATLNNNAGVYTTASQNYDAWGNKLSSNGTINQYGYTGREADENGLIYHRARYRNPATDRFISKDPIGLAGGINQYSYTAGNPISYNDPSGLTVQDPLHGYFASTTQSYYSNSSSNWAGSGTSVSQLVTNAQGQINSGVALAAGSDTGCACVGSARVYQGNADLIGKGGGFNTSPSDLTNYAVTRDSAAVIPSQFGMSKPEMRRVINQISGSLSDGTKFNAVRDIMDDAPTRKSLGMTTSQFQQHLIDRETSSNGGVLTLLIELPGITKDKGVTGISINMPSGYACPTGTQLQCSK